jgi:hypothetical protein
LSVGVQEAGHSRSREMPSSLSQPAWVFFRDGAAGHIEPGLPRSRVIQRHVMAGVAVFVFLGTFMRDHAVCKPLVEFALGATNLAWHILTYILDELKLAAKLAAVGGEPLRELCSLSVHSAEDVTC